MSLLEGRRILLGVTGGVAAYKAATLLRLLKKAGADVRVVMTESATRFVGPATFQALSGQAVWTDLWDTRVPDGMGHIELSRDRDLILIAPASADILAHAALGLAPDLLSTIVVARRCPLYVAPAMNVEMWDNAATQRNLARLREDGVVVIGPAPGEQACGETGMGRMLEPEQILEILNAGSPGKKGDTPLRGKRVLLTAGPTQEPIDPVRMITNASSGKMGFAVARAARDAGAEVDLIAGPVALETPSGVLRVDVRTAAEMRDAVMARVGKSDIFISVAAVADYRVKRASERKIKKEAVGALTLELEPNPDILAEVAALSKPPFCVGFAAESEALAENAQAKRARKRIPLLAANLVQDAVGGDENAITLFDDGGAHPLGRGSKADQARRLVDHLAAMIARGGKAG